MGLSPPPGLWISWDSPSRGAFRGMADCWGYTDISKVGNPIPGSAPGGALWAAPRICVGLGVSPLKSFFFERSLYERYWCSCCRCRRVEYVCPQCGGRYCPSCLQLRDLEHRLMDRWVRHGNWGLRTSVHVVRVGMLFLAVLRSALLAPGAPGIAVAFAADALVAALQVLVVLGLAGCPGMLEKVTILGAVDFEPSILGRWR